MELKLWCCLVFTGAGDNASQFSVQDSDGEKSDDNLVVDVSNEVCLWLASLPAALQL